MNFENSSSGQSSAVTSPTPPVVATSETKFLMREAADAKTAMAHTVRSIGSGLKQKADEHPFLVIAGAAIAGALAARAITPPPAHREENDSGKSFWGHTFAFLGKPIVQELALAGFAMLNNKLGKQDTTATEPASAPEQP
jgi:hypothetical protein